MWWVLIIAAAVQRLAGLAPRFEPRCGPSDAAYANFNDIIACYHYLDRLGHQNFAVPGYGVVSEFCRAGSGHIIGQSTNSDGTSSYW